MAAVATVVCKDATVDAPPRVVLGAGCVVHPTASLRARGGPDVRLELGAGCIVAERASVLADGAPLLLGAHSVCNVGASLRGSGRVGAHTHLAPRSALRVHADARSCASARSESAAVVSRDDSSSSDFEALLVGNHCHIGANTHVLCCPHRCFDGNGGGDGDSGGDGDGDDDASVRVSSPLPEGSAWLGAAPCQLRLARADHPNELEELIHQQQLDQLRQLLPRFHHLQK